MTEKFTQGEWRASEFSYNNGESTDFYISSGLKEVSVCLPTGRVSKEEAKANAALIAAAPEMYRMLKYLADGVRYGGIQHTDRSLAAEIENLLKKARGNEWKKENGKV